MVFLRGCSEGGSHSSRGRLRAASGSPGATLASGGIRTSPVDSMAPPLSCPETTHASRLWTTLDSSGVALRAARATPSFSALPSHRRPTFAGARRRLQGSAPRTKAVLTVRLTLGAPCPPERGAQAARRPQPLPLCASGAHRRVSHFCARTVMMQVVTARLECVVGPRRPAVDCSGRGRAVTGAVVTPCYWASLPPPPPPRRRDTTWPRSQGSKIANSKGSQGSWEGMGGVAVHAPGVCWLMSSVPVTSPLVPAPPPPLLPSTVSSTHTAAATAVSPDLWREVTASATPRHTATRPHVPRPVPSPVTYPDLSRSVWRLTRVNPPELGTRHNLSLACR